MKITKIDVWQVVVPSKPGTTYSQEIAQQLGADFTAVPKNIIRIHTDDGFTGIGETERGVSHDEVVRISKQLVGRDVMKMSLQHIFRTKPLGLPATWKSQPEMDLGPYPVAYEAFEMAVFDLVGKRLGVPVHMLLGGACRDKVKVHYWISMMNAKDSARSTRIALDRGFKGLKIKCKIEEPLVERMRAIWEVGGADFKVNLDPNERFHTVDQTLALAEQLKELGNVEMFEDPIPLRYMQSGSGPIKDYLLPQYRYLRERMPFPLALSTMNLSETIRAVSAGASDYLNLGGSMVDFVKCAAIAQAASIPVWHGSGVDLGITEMSMIHATSAVPNCVLANDLVGSWVRVDDLIVEGLTFENGQTSVPQSPGLGCELDMDAVEKYRV